MACVGSAPPRLLRSILCSSSSTCIVTTRSGGIACSAAIAGVHGARVCRASAVIGASTFTFTITITITALACITCSGSGTGVSAVASPSTPQQRRQRLQKLFRACGCANIHA